MKSYPININVGVPNISTPIPKYDCMTDRTAITANNNKCSIVMMKPEDP